ncbi:Pycsar system effector family protein [Streptomyces sp. NPDC020412]|uniref:Pycsar system effector family protein n=1 Tax=Streptomyces sp. NPDC020412 TaxID=3365073 RepID=UPI0037B0C1D5
MPTEERLNIAIADTESQIVKADSKAASVLTFDGLLVAGASLMSSGNDVSTLATVLAVITGLLIVISASLSLSVIRPRLTGGDKQSFVHWSTLESGDAVEESLTNTPAKTERILILSRIAFRKMCLLQKAIDTSLGAVIALLLTIATSL